MGASGEWLTPHGRLRLAWADAVLPGSAEAVDAAVAVMCSAGDHSEGEGRQAARWLAEAEVRGGGPGDDAFLDAPLSDAEAENAAETEDAAAAEEDAAAQAAARSAAAAFRLRRVRARRWVIPWLAPGSFEGFAGSMGPR